MRYWGRKTTEFVAALDDAGFPGSRTIRVRVFVQPRREEWVREGT